MQLDVATMTPQGIEFTRLRIECWFKMQAGVRKQAIVKKREAARNLNELRRGEHGILERIDLPEDDARRLMELGFLPGHTITPAHAAPGGDPRVFRVDGTEIALRRDTARKLILRDAGANPSPHSHHE
jgi:ferrous iron transport protein A